MKAPPDDYAALRWLNQAAAEAAELANVVDHALSLKAQIPTLEARQIALAAEVDQAKGAAAAAKRERDAAELDYERTMTGLKAEREAEQAGLAADKQRREASAKDDLARLNAEYRAREADRRGVIGGLELEIQDLERRKANLARSLTEAIAAASRK